MGIDILTRGKEDVGGEARRRLRVKSRGKDEKKLAIGLSKIRLPPISIERVERALRRVFHVAHDMGVDHGRLYMLVPKETLYLPDIDSTLKQMCRKAVTECMDARMLSDAGLAHGISHRHLDGLFADMVTTDPSASWVHRQLGCRKNILPGPFPACFRILAAQRIGQICLSVALREVTLMQAFHIFKVPL